MFQGKKLVSCHQTTKIDKSQLLGQGSYGTVYKAKYGQLPCAAKILHPTIVDPADPGAGKIVERFQQECVFLKCFRHSNIVQYLAVIRDPESRLPVLLMELLDESLTKMLERSQSLLAYCVQVDICHDITQAVAYLHSRDVIHRDLSSNNVLMIASRKAKVADFGMSKLVDAVPRMTPLTMCPGIQDYMPPEALKEPSNYAKKLDCFSVGVLMIQVCTLLWPEPGPLTKRRPDSNSPTGEVEVPVLEMERRKNHIDMISHDHPLLPITKHCLEYRDKNRPSSEQLCQRLAALKEAREYKENFDKVQVKSDQISLLSQQLQVMDVALQRCQLQVEEQEMITAETQQTNQYLCRQIEQLHQQQSQLSLMPPQSPLHSQVDHKPHPILNWRHGSEAPLKICRGATVVNGSVAYFMHNSGEVCSYCPDNKMWREVTKCPYEYSSLAVVNGLLIAVGGCLNIRNCDTYSNKLLRLPDYKEVFPHMPTKRWNTTAVTLSDILIVAGGRIGPCDCSSSVEVMNTKTRIWSTVASLPYPCTTASGTICGEQLYMLGGSDAKGKTKSVLTCSLTELLESSSSSSPLSVWQRIADAPAYNSTCASISGQLLLFGGYNDSGGCHVPTADVHMYNITTNSWDLISTMPSRKFLGCIAVLPTNEVMVVGGFNNEQHCGTDLVEVATYT